MSHCTEHNSNQRYCSEFHEKLIEFRDDGKFCDVNIRVQDETFRCHRLVLASASEYFDRMFGGNFKEANQSEDIVLHEIDAKSFDTIIKCLYNQCTPIVNELNVCGLLRISEFLGVSKVKEQCVLFIRDNIQKTDSIALELLSLACAMNDSQLIDWLSTYIFEKLDVFVEKSDFLDLSYHDLHTMLNCYRASLLTYKCENFLLDALIKWVYFVGDRKPYFMNLVEMLDFDRIGIIEKQDNDEIFEKNVVINGVELSEYYHDCYSALELSRLKKVPTSSRNSPTLHIYFSSESKHSQKTNCAFHVLSLDNSRIEPRWYPSCSFSSSCRLSSIISLLVLNEPAPYSIYCMDFVHHEFWAHSSIDLSQNDQVLKRLTPLKFSTSHRYCKPCMRKIDGDERSIYLYQGIIEHSNSSIFRGFSLEESNRGIYRYNCELDHWYPMPKMKKKLSDCCFITDDKLLYLIGGENIHGIEPNYVQAYDHRISEWFELPNTINSYYYNRNYCAQGCAGNGKLYLSDDNRRIEVYDPVASRWEKFSSIGGIEDVDEAVLAGAYNPYLTFYSNSLWVIHCLDSYQTCDKYDFLSQKWCKFPFLAPKLQDTFMQYEPVDVITA